MSTSTQYVTWGSLSEQCSNRTLKIKTYPSPFRKTQFWDHMIPMMHYHFAAQIANFDATCTKYAKLERFYNPCSFVAKEKIPHIISVTQKSVFASHRRSKHTITKLEEEPTNPTKKTQWSQISAEENKQNIPAVPHESEVLCNCATVC